MLWGAPIPENVGSPVVVQALLERALAADPDNAALHAKLAYVHVDRKDYAAAAASFENSLRLDPAQTHPRLIAARCYNFLGRHDRAVAVLEPVDQPSFERGRALMELGDTAGAEREFRAVLADNPHDAAVCRMFSRMLRRAGRRTELLALCEDLAARGAANAQLLFTWGSALAHSGDVERARQLMFDPRRTVEIDLPAPAGFSDIAAFNAALAEEILSNPNKISEFPVDEANRGSSRVDNLFTGRRPELIELLLGAFQRAVAAYVPEPLGEFDPWPGARPAAARLQSWGLIQRGGEYEEAHIHPSGWLSGVYYVQVPSVASADGAGPACIEFGPPASVAERFPGLMPTRRYAPRDGMLLLSPSHYQHRTIPSGVDEHRISVAFDVVPEPGI
jgi:tetratricopeptide (TPR) repeat protein